MKKRKSVPALIRIVLLVSLWIATSVSSPPAPAPKGQKGSAKGGRGTGAPVLNNLKSCGLRINEINGNFLEKWAKRDFLELKAICSDPNDNPSGASLFGHKIVFLSPKLVKGGSGVILGVIALQNYYLSPNGFYTIGGQEVDPKSLPSTSTSVKIQGGGTRSALSLFQKKTPINENEKRLPFGIAIIRISSRDAQADLGAINLEANNLEKVITPEIEHILSKNIIDLVIYNQDAQVTSCDLFSRIAPDLEGKQHYVLRDWERHVPAATSRSSAAVQVDASIESCSQKPAPAIAPSTPPPPQSSSNANRNQQGSSRNKRGQESKGQKAAKGTKGAKGAKGSKGGVQPQITTFISTRPGASNSKGETGSRAGTSSHSSMASSSRQAQLPVTPGAQAPQLPATPGVQAPQLPVTPGAQAPQLPITPGVGVQAPRLPVTPGVQAPQLPATPGVQAPQLPVTPGVQAPQPPPVAGSSSQLHSASRLPAVMFVSGSPAVQPVASGSRSPPIDPPPAEPTHPVLSGQSQIKKYSLSRCSETSTDGFRPEDYKVTLPTPHAENACECGIPFILQQFAPHLYNDFASLMSIDNSLVGPEPLPGGCMLSPGRGGDEIEEIVNDNNDAVSSVSTRAINTIWSYRTENGLDRMISLDEAQQGAMRQEEIEVLERLLNSGSTNSQQMEPADNVAITEPPTECNVGGGTKAERDILLENQYTDMLSLAQQHQADKVPVKYLRENKLDETLQLREWLEYLPQVHKPQESKFRCRLCVTGKNSKYISSKITKNPPKLASEEGILYADQEQFRKAIQKHAKGPLHLAVKEQQQIEEKERLEGAVKRLRKRNLNRLGVERKATSDMLTTVYAEAKMYLPFSSHPKMMALFDKLDLHALRFWHHRDQVSAARMVTHISNQMQKKFLHWLVQKERPFALLLDSGTDSIGNDFCSVQFQLLENNHPRIVHYKIIKLEVDVSAAGYRNSIKKAMDADVKTFELQRDLWTWVGANIHGFISDGVAVLAGDKGGLGVTLSKEFFNDTTKLFRVHCGAHRLQLATRTAVDKLPELGKFEGQLKSVSKFYNQQHPKNYAHVQETANVLNRTLRGISYIFPTRWCTNAALVIARTIHNLPTLMLGIPGIAAPQSGFSAETRAEAGGLANFISNLEFHGWVYTIADIINTLNFYSAQLQTAGDSIIGRGHYYNDMKGDLEGLKTNYGKASREFLLNLECNRDVHSPRFNPVITKAERDSNKYKGDAWTKIDRSLRCRWEWKGGFKLDLQRENIVGAETRGQATAREASQGNFEEQRIKVLDTIIKQVDKFFPENDVYKAADIFHRSQFNKQQMLEGVYGDTQINILAQRFRLPQPGTSDEFKRFFQSFANHGRYEELIRLSPKRLYPIILNDATNDFNLGTNARKLIRTLLVIPPSTASVERSFSILKHLKSERRSKLTTARLDALMRISINGPNDLNLFPVESMTLSWKGRETGSKKYNKKRKNVESVECQANIPPKLSILTTAAEEVEEQEAQQALREKEMDMFEIGIGQGEEADEFVYPEEFLEPEIPEEDMFDQVDFLVDL